MRIIITLFLLLISGCTQANLNCLGNDQTSSVVRYKCLSNNAFVALSTVGKHLDNEFARAKLYKLDDEMALGTSPPNYVLSITSLDIGEPAIVLGLRSNKYLTLDLNSKGSFDLIDKSGTLHFRVVVKSFDDIKVNGITF